MNSIVQGFLSAASSAYQGDPTPAQFAVAGWPVQFPWPSQYTSFHQNPHWFSDLFPQCFSVPGIPRHLIQSTSSDHFFNEKVVSPWFRISTSFPLVLSPELGKHVYQRYHPPFSSMSTSWSFSNFFLLSSSLLQVLLVYYSHSLAQSSTSNATSTPFHNDSSTFIPRNIPFQLTKLQASTPCTTSSQQKPQHSTPLNTSARLLALGQYRRVVQQWKTLGPIPPLRNSGTSLPSLRTYGIQLGNNIELQYSFRHLRRNPFIPFHILIYHMSFHPPLEISRATRNPWSTNIHMTAVVCYPVWPPILVWIGWWP